MENENYKKDFKPFLIWLILFMVGMNGFPMLVKLFPSMSVEVQTKLSIFLLLAAILILYYIIFKGEFIYYVPGGPTFEEAKAVGSEKRKVYAKKSFIGMMRASMLTLIFMVISLFMGLSGFYDWIVAGACVGAAAFSTMKEKLHTDEVEEVNRGDSEE